jgi:lysyl-tRNA synthetase class 2
MRAARSFFARRRVLEVETPTLATRTVTEPHIDSLKTCLNNTQTLFLQTSPEYFMKRLLAHGYPDIYQVCKVFRDGEIGRHHLPEFTMVEWYRLNYSLQQIMRECVAFVSHVIGRKSLCENVDYVSYVDAFTGQLELDPLNCDIDSLADAVQADNELRESLGTEHDAWLDLVLTEKVVSAFATDRLTVVHHYPASQAALARRCPDDHRVADRFEVYYGTLELANGFVELTDADEQLARFEHDQKKRRDRGQDIPAIDENLIAALRHGLPSCAGVAVGFDRLMMILEKASDIGAIHTFSCEH